MILRRQRCCRHALYVTTCKRPQQASRRTQELHQALPRGQRSCFCTRHRRGGSSSMLRLDHLQRDAFVRPRWAGTQMRTAQSGGRETHRHAGAAGAAGAAVGIAWRGTIHVQRAPPRARRLSPRAVLARTAARGSARQIRTRTCDHGAREAGPAREAQTRAIIGITSLCDAL